MTKTVQKGRSHELEHLRKEVERLSSALTAIKNQKDAYFLEIREDDGESFRITRTYYRAKKDAVNDLNVAKHAFCEGDEALLSKSPEQVARGNVDLTISRDDGHVFRGIITRIKIL